MLGVVLCGGDGGEEFISGGVLIGGHERFVKRTALTGAAQAMLSEKLRQAVVVRCVAVVLVICACLAVHGSVLVKCEFKIDTRRIKQLVWPDWNDSQTLKTSCLIRV